MTHDYRWFAADTVMRKSTAALAALTSAYTLANAHGSAEIAPEFVESALVIETERAIRMSTEAMQEALESFTQTEADGEAN